MCLPDKAASESRERVRAAPVASGLALPARRITVNLAPADMPKEGSHYDLPIALGMMAAIGAIPSKSGRMNAVLPIGYVPLLEAAEMVVSAPETRRPAFPQLVLFVLFIAFGFRADAV